MIKYLTILTLFLAFPFLTYVSDINDTQGKAMTAFRNKDYLIAIYRYEYLTEKLKVKDPNVYLNLAHSYYKAGKWEKARKYYLKTIKNNNTALSSLAYHQLGMISETNYNKESSVDDLQSALKFFKQAIKSNPNNLKARYNYELLRKKLEALRKFVEKNNPRKSGKSKSGKNKRKGGNGKKQKSSQGEGDGEQDEKQGKKQASKNGKDQMDKNDPDGEENDSKSGNKKNDKNNLRPDKLKAININQEKIKTIFEALKNQEIQYLQQKRRRNKRGKKGYGKNKPDW